MKTIRQILGTIANLFIQHTIWFISFDPTDCDGYKALKIQLIIFRLIKSLTDHSCYMFVFVNAKAHPNAEIIQTHGKETEYYDEDGENIELHHVAKMLYQIGEDDIIVVIGSRHVDNPVPLEFLKNADVIYKECADTDKKPKIINISECANIIRGIFKEAPETKIFMDFFGCVGYFPQLAKYVGEELLAKGLRNTVIPVMGGIWEGATPNTLALPKRHRWATMNQIYNKEATKYFLHFCRQYNVKLFYCTNTKCNEFAKFQNVDHMITTERLTGLMEKITRAWPFPADKCIDFDVLAFVTYLLYLADPEEVEVIPMFLNTYTDPSIHFLTKTQITNGKTEVPDTEWIDGSFIVDGFSKTSDHWLEIAADLLSS
jgi:hypothetical protein